MKRIFLTLFAGLFLLAGCTSNKPTDAEKAMQYIERGQALVNNGDLNSAKTLLDSVHINYPKCVAQRRLAQSIQDSIVYIEAQRTSAYSDSLLQTILPQVDPVLKKFSYEKEEKYEDHGRYVHRLLVSTNNATRCYLQAYVSDDRVTTVKSHYFGNGTLDQTAIELSANDEELRIESRQSHGFTIAAGKSDGYHSILTFDNDQSLSLLNFISAHQADRIRVKLYGTTKNDTETTYVYYLLDSEKTALQDSYQLGILMHDINALEEAIRKANMQIELYKKRHGML